jgi:mono/diheme cytochrome c family protein
LGAATFLIVVWVLAAAPAAQAPGQTSQVPKVVSIAARPILSVEGKDNFDAYCAVCHGADGKGHGPAAPAMKSVVPDLTTMAQRNNGRFDASAVGYIINHAGQLPTPAHGVDTMPMWGEVFRAEDPNRALLRVNNLVNYIRALQVGTTGS